VFAVLLTRQKSRLDVIKIGLACDVCHLNRFGLKHIFTAEIEQKILM